MVLLTESEFHFIQSIRNGKVIKEQNVGLHGRPRMKFKKVVDLYEASVPVGFTWKKNGCRRNLFNIETAKTDACCSAMEESDQAILDNEVPLIVWKSTLVKKLKSKKHMIKPGEDLNEDNVFSAPVKSECSLSSTFLESSIADVDIEEGSKLDCPSMPCSVFHERDSSSDIVKQADVDEGAGLLDSTEPTACSSAEEHLKRASDDEDENSGYSVLTETTGDGSIPDGSTHHEITSLTGEDGVLRVDIHRLETPVNHGNSHISMKPNVHGESSSCNTEGIQHSSMDIEPSEDEDSTPDIDQAGNHSALHLSTDRIFSKRKTISPISQEELCRALKISELNDDVKNSKLERLKETPEGNSFTPRSILKVPKCSPAIPPLRKGCTCAHSAIAFSLRQMHDIESLALKLTEEMNGMKGILDRAIHHDGFSLTDEAMVAMESARRAEDTTNRWLSMMARDCNRFCRIMKKRKAEKGGLGSGGSKERKKIVFADEVGKMLCDVKVLDDDDVSESET